MKKLFILILVVVSGFMPFSSSAQISVNINIGSQPLWGPVGYDHVDYYYLPDIESYYYVPRRQFIYLSNGEWIFSTVLPSRYSNYDLYNGYKVVINSPKPYLHFKEQKVKYAKYKSNRGQAVILRSDNPKYYVVKGHPKNKSKGNEKGPQGKGNFKEKGKGNSKSESKGQGKGKH
ncbi:hypothetical protein [Pedobacter nyackensis]|uniref:Uncharacterized protein n=1 Tax=Pedobacter nyackensis TaxID=475255 RepID=A0A1W2E2W8_9SPHI|nr:hypothetical protein [Pedobacter nyackensis]SMD03418.1 hypothetical protein SAMN04488101_10975 [Pedobacter nyackensis]